ncbi:MAG TPA: response regulator [Microvirga sp.]|jgi:CheY-like chemotaxis protein|nr:response regulator [Microvirga sp.]
MSTAGPTIILAVDDEPVELQFIALVLGRAGYEVIGTASGPSALAVLEARSDVALVVADCRMPHMSGPELLGQIAVRWPEIKLIATSGAPEPDDLPDKTTFLQKPYRPSVLTHHVDRRLNRVQETPL